MWGFSYDSTSGGEREIQRTMLELLNQLDGFDSRGDVKVSSHTSRFSFFGCLS
jgi:26S proteasome regulatory subunit T2